MNKRFIIILAVSTLLCNLFLFATHGHQKKNGGGKSAKADTLASAVSYKNVVLPIFKTYCLPCHTEDQMNPSDLYLDSYDGLMNGGKHGKTVIPGAADSSLLIRKLQLPSPFGDLMPLKTKTPISSDTVDILKNWINQGAKDN